MSLLPGAPRWQGCLAAGGDAVEDNHVPEVVDFGDVELALPQLDVEDGPVDTLRIVAAESGLTPARALLDHQQAGFTRRLFARP